MKRNVMLQKEEKSLLALIVVTVMGISIFTFMGSNTFFNSDTATANLLAYEQIKQGNLFPTEWVYAQDIWTFFLNIPIILMSIFMKNQLLMRSISSMIFIVIGLYSVYIFHKTVFEDRSWLISIPCLFSGLSLTYAPMVFGQTAYLPLLFYILFSIILFTSAVNSEFKIVNKRFLILLAAFIVFLGISGLRYIQAIDIPLMGAILLVYFLEKIDLGKTRKSAIQAFLCISLIFLFTCLGFLLFHAIKSHVNFVEGATSVMFSSYEKLNYNISMLFQSIFLIFGIEPNVNLFSIMGIINIIKICATICIGFVFPLKLIQKYKEQSFKMKIFIVFSLIHVSIIILLVVFTGFIIDLSASRYMLTSVFLIFILSAFYIFNYIFQGNQLKKACVVLGMIIFLFSSLYPVLMTSKGYQTNMSEMKGVINFLEENDLKYGYATYWNAGKHTVLSDFNVRINAITIGENNLSPFYWLSSREWYKPKYYSGKSFLLLTKEEKSVVFKDKLNLTLGDPNAILSYNDYEIIVYNYNIAEKAWTTDNN